MEFSAVIVLGCFKERVGGGSFCVFRGVSVVGVELFCVGVLCVFWLVAVLF